METAADLDLLEQAMNSTEPIPTLRYSFFIAIDIAIVITCILSILGAGAIIVSYLGFKELRTTSRFLLFHLSIADAVVAIANMIGAGYRTANVLIYQDIDNNTMPLCIFTGGFMHASFSVGMFGVVHRLLLDQDQQQFPL